MTTALFTFSMMQTKLMVEPMSTCSSPEPRMKASGTTTCRLTKCDMTPVDVDTYANWVPQRVCVWNRHGITALICFGLDMQ